LTIKSIHPINIDDALQRPRFPGDPCPHLREHGAQAPGKPLKENGFVPPKNWDGKKEKHPKTGQYGWKDKKENIWVPTGWGAVSTRRPTLGRYRP